MKEEGAWARYVVGLIGGRATARRMRREVEGKWRGREG